MTLAEALQRAVAAQRADRPAEAEDLCRQIVAAVPDHFDAWHVMAIAQSSAGRHADALASLERALALQPENAQALCNRGLALRGLGRDDEALATYESALRLRPGYAEARYNRANLLYGHGQLDAALADFDAAVAARPDFAGALNNRGLTLHELYRTEEALASYDAAIRLKPDFAVAHNNRGNALLRLKRQKEALAAYDRAIALRPDYAQAHNNRALLLRELVRYDDALAACERAIAIDPDYADAHYFRGSLLRAMNRLPEARAAHARSVAVKPGNPDARLGLCMAELPIIYTDTVEIDACRTAYERALAALCAELEGAPNLAAYARAIGSNQPFFLAYQGRNDRALQERYGRLVCRIMAARYGRAPLPAPPRAGEKIRIGIVSGFFTQHSNWKQPISGWLSQLDRRRFRIAGFHTGTQRDAATDRARGLCDTFIAGPLPVERWREAILKEAPHVLIYPEIGMDSTVPALAAQRLAPVQCNFWGHPETSGMPTVDYFLTSALMEPPDGEAHYTERLVRLPNLSIYYEPLVPPPTGVTRETLGLRPAATLYWCAQSTFKFLPQYDPVFARIAREAGDVQFVFLDNPGAAQITDIFRARLRRTFADLGLDADRYCAFLPRMDMRDFSAASGLCDVFLDSLGWSGGNTTLESLIHDLPIVTMPADTMRSRHSAAILQQMGIGETIAGSIDAYVALAVRMARDPAWRGAVRAKVAANKHRVYRDRTAIAALESFLESVARAPAGDAGVASTAALPRAADAAAAFTAGRLAEAEALCRAILERRPDDFDALHLLACAQSRAGNPRAALASFGRALAVRPDSPEAHSNRAVALHDLRRWADALDGHDRAIALRPDFAAAHYNRALTLREMRRFGDALASCERAIALQPDYPDALYFRGVLLRAANRADAAAASFAQALALRPNFAEARLAACMANLPILYESEAEIDERRARYAAALLALEAEVAADPNPGRFADRLGAHQPFYLAYQGRNDRDLQGRYGAMVRRIVAARYGAARPAPAPAAGEKIRIGIVSGFFSQHSNWKVPIQGWLSQLDRDRFRLFGYHTGPGDDTATRAARGLCERFVAGPRNPEAWRAAILQDAPHVLIYPEIGMDPTAVVLAAQRLAGVQCASWGHPQTTGLPTMDYFLSSDLMEPVDGQAHYTERLVRLPGLSIWYAPVPLPPLAATRESCGLRAGATVFWCGQSTFKFLPQFDTVFARIARATGDCQFVFVDSPGAAEVAQQFRKRLARAFSEFGLDAGRHCVFLPRLDMRAFGAAMGLSDVFLDSIGWSGCNTTLESLAHDLPIVTLAGTTMRARHSAAILRQIGVTDTIATSVDDYVALAARLARDGEWRAAVRARIASGKTRVYRDRAAIDALEDFLIGVVKPPGSAHETPDFDMLHRMAVQHAQNRRFDAALAAFDRALAMRPDDAAALTNRSNVLGEMHRLDAARAGYDRAIAARPAFVPAYYNRAYLMRTLDRPQDATADYERVLALDPGYAAARFALCATELRPIYRDAADLHRQRTAYDDRLRALEDAASSVGDLAGWAPAVGSNQPFLLAYQGQNDRTLQARYGALVCRIMAARYGVAALPTPPAPNEPLRVGIVSGFFRKHSNWKTRIRGWLEQLDRGRFRVYGYHTGLPTDGIADLAARQCTRFVQGPLPIERWRAEIAADAPHVLIYPEVGMDPSAAALAAQRLAPVQCTAWGHPDTSGFPTLDYFLSSDLMEPPDGQEHYTEALVRLPGTTIWWEPGPAATDVTDGRLARGLRGSATVYWCAQTLSKFLPQHDDLFARIARDAGSSQFVFIEHPHGPHVTRIFRERLDRVFGAAGLATADHCVFLPQLGGAEFAAAAGLCDVFLDSVGWSGCNTTLESLAHDLPIITLPGSTMRSRHSAAILRRMGITDTIAGDTDAYVALAARAAREPAWRAAQKALIARRKHRVFRDRDAIDGLAAFLDRAGRPS